MMSRRVATSDSTVIDLRANERPRPRVRVAIIDDHPVFAESLAMALEAEPDFSVTGIASTPWEARDLLGAGADIAVVDVDFREYPGLDLARDLAATFPGVRLVMLSDGPDPKVLEHSLTMGVGGYVPKSVSLRQLIECLRNACIDQIAVPASLLAEVMDGFRRRETQRRAAGTTRSLLTDREFEILALLAEGLSTKAIAGRLTLSINTVRSHAQNTLTKLGAHSRLEAVAYARAAGLMEDGHDA